MDESGIVSERRVVTVLFADVAGSTAIFEKLDPEIVTEVMNELFGVLGAEVAAVDGHVDKVVGDELMALFGAPVAHEDDALRAVRAALAMQRVVRARAETLRPVLGVAPRLRIGIHAGQVVWGVVGPPGQARPTVMGDVVNLASRLQRAAPEGGVLVSEPVARQIRGAFLTRAWAPLVVKGKTEPVAVYEVVGEREQAEPMHRPPFVDREADLEQLAELFARTRRGRAQVVVVSGDPGVGKTRLVEEFVQRLADDVRLLQTACPPYGGQSLGPLADLFRQLAGIAGATTVAAVEARLPLGERAGRAALILSRLFNLAEVPAGDAVTHETALLVAAETIRRMLDGPTVVWIEDLQWADAGSRELLPFMMERLADAPLLLIGNLRAGEDPPAWGKRTAVATMQLEPLADQDARMLLGTLVGNRLPADVEDALVARAGGNPFYLAEIVATLRSRGVLVADDRGRWRVSEAVQKVLPDTVQAALLARLDRLPAEQRALLQRAAVVGVSFAQSLMAELSPGVNVAALLQQLEDSYLIRRRDPLAADPEYVFVHPLLREAAYGSLLLKSQTVMHRQVAEAWERLYPDQPEELAKTIGTHFDRGGAPERALPYLVRAGRQAATRYATQEAIELLERARDLAAVTGQPALGADASEILGDLYQRVQGRGAKDWFAAWQFVVQNVDPTVDPVRVARAAIAAAYARALDNEPAGAWEMLRRAEPIIPPDHPLWSDFHRVRAVIFTIESEYRDALAAARTAVEIANRAGSLLDRSRAYDVLAHPALLPLLGEAGRRMMRDWVAEAEAAKDERILMAASVSFSSDVWTRGLVDEDVFRLAEEARRKAQEYGWTHDEAKLRVLLGWGHFLAGRWHEAEVHLRWARDVVDAGGGRIHTIGWLILLPYAEGNLAMGQGRLAEAAEIFQEGLAKYRFHAPIWLSHDLGRCLAMQGDVAGARAVMERSLRERDRIRCIICGCQANGVAAEFYAALGDGAAAVPLLDAAEATAREIGHVTTRIRVRRARARLALWGGAVEEALTAAQEGLALGQSLPLPQPYEQAQSLQVLGEAYRAAGDRDHAVESLRRARETFRALGAVWYVARTEEALSQTGVSPR